MDGFKPRGFGVHIRRGVLPLDSARRGAMVTFLVACFVSGVAQPFRRAVQRPACSAFRCARHSHRGVGRRRLRICHRQHARILHRRCSPHSRQLPLCRAPLAHAGKPPSRTPPFGASALAVCCVGFSTINIENDLNVNADVEQPRFLSGARVALCFAQRAQKISPHEPEGYSETRAAELRSQKAMTETVDELIDDPHVVSAAEATDPDGAPTIIAIMNETYSDISTYPQLAKKLRRPHSPFDARGNHCHGRRLCVGNGGGTCNSEFEFLTGSSMGLWGRACTPICSITSKALTTWRHI